MNLHSPSKSTTNSHVVCKECSHIIFPLNSWLSFQQLYHLLGGYFIIAYKRNIGLNLLYLYCNHNTFKSVKQWNVPEFELKHVQVYM